MKVILSALILSILTFSCVDANYFVQLKKPATLSKLLEFDDRLKSSRHLRPLVKKVISIGSFEGFSVNITKDVAKYLKKNPFVQDVVPDLSVKLYDDDNDEDEIAEPSDFEEYYEDYLSSDYPSEDFFKYKRELHDFDESHGTEVKFSQDYETQFIAPRHLARLSRRQSLPFNQSVNYYYDPTSIGNNVYVYVIDTGVYKDHPDFEGRVIEGENFSGVEPGDTNGHGTHVAGIIGSRTFGVAKGVTIVDVKALDGRGHGSLTTVISAMEFATKHRKEHNVKGVINMSLGSFQTPILNRAVQSALDDGMVVVAAAGNNGVDSCRTSPASSGAAIVVGAIDDKTDDLADFTNWGQCVDVFTSGVTVTSLSHKNDTHPHFLSGTSMSSPSVAGMAAILLDKGVDVKNVKGKIVNMSTEGIIPMKTLANKPQTPNKILFNGVPKQDDEFPEQEEYNSEDVGYFQPEHYSSKAVNYKPKELSGMKLKGGDLSLDYYDEFDEKLPMFSDDNEQDEKDYEAYYGCNEETLWSSPEKCLMRTDEGAVEEDYTGQEFSVREKKMGKKGVRSLIWS